MRMPVIMYDADSKGAFNYLNLAREILHSNDLISSTEDSNSAELN